VANQVDQSRAEAKGDLAGRDIVTTTNVYQSSHSAGVVERLLESLHAEMKDDQRTSEIIDRLKRFYVQRSHDGVVGLEAKLEKSGRGASYLDAIEMKEMFAKLIERWSLYNSAQQILVHLLARAERQFNDIILPQAPKLDVIGVNKLMNVLIVDPTVLECGPTILEMDHNTAMGMIYWLAEQCFVRWHL
jgi:hypothetical protein